MVGDEGAGEAGAGAGDAGAPRQYELPKQLRQHYLEVPCKLRLVALVALLRAKAAAPRRGAAGRGGGGGKVVVFLSTCAGVDFHHALLSGPLCAAAGGRLPTRLFKLHGQLVQVTAFPQQPSVRPGRTVLPPLLLPLLRKRCAAALAVPRASCGDSRMLHRRVLIELCATKSALV